MLFDDTYKTIDSSSQGLFRDKGSKFIGLAFPVRNEEEIKTLILTIKKEHSQANHYCYAYRLTPDTSIYRVNDDREPSGSAGKPILGVINSLQLTDILIVVVRYFGGSLLGVPGLINAYKTAAQEALKNVKLIEKTINESIEINFPYEKMNEIHSILKTEIIKIKNQDYNEPCKIVFELRKSKVNSFLLKLKEHPTLPSYATWEIK